jgi:hypothetical protein
MLGVRNREEGLCLVISEKSVNQDDFRSARDDSDASEFVHGTSVLVPGEEFFVCLGGRGNILFEDGKEIGGVKGEDGRCCQEQAQGIQPEPHCPFSSGSVW